jgi:hypothetical protein
MRRPGRTPEDRLGDICGGERRHPLVDAPRALLVAAEADPAELGLDQPRVDRADANAGAEDVAPRPLRDGVERMLGRAVHRTARVDLAPRDRADVDHVASPPLHHPRQNRAGHREHALDIGVDHLVPVAHVAAVDRVERPAEARIVDQDSDLRPLGGQLGQHVRHHGGVAHVEREGVHLGSVFPLEVRGQRLEPIGAPGDQEQPRAGGCKGARARLADSGGGTRDQNRTRKVHRASRAGMSR